MQIRVVREYNSPCTGGHMDIDGSTFGITLERPWLDNQNTISCIPPGKYQVAITMSTKFGRPMMEILNVPGRSGIRIHNANRSEEVEGCIAVARCRQNPDYISGGLAEILFKMVEQAGGAEIEIVNAWGGNL